MNQILKPSIDKKDFIECEYCKNKLYRKTIEWELYGTKRTITLDYERCECNNAQAYWNEYDLKKLRMLEEEKKLELMQEFSKRVERIIKNSKMSKRNLSYKFDNFEPNNSNRKIFNNLKNYSEKLINGIEKKGLILVGNNGVGKTHLACSIANKLIENGILIIYGTLINLLAELRNSYDTDNNISEMEIIKLYENVDLLIIDDLGKEKPSEWGLEKLFTIINSRYENNLPVIITTNYNQNSIIERLSINGEIDTAKSIISRLYEMCYLVKIDDIDHRIKKKKVSNCENND
ncbi:MAG: ATP-binding protein [Clostridia bacterium]|nr:ATP-binding protein [Clostridia bacterium]